jgi:hypothetical protein
VGKCPLRQPLLIPRVPPLCPPPIGHSRNLWVCHRDETKCNVTVLCLRKFVKVERFMLLIRAKMNEKSKGKRHFC